MITITNFDNNIKYKVFVIENLKCIENNDIKILIDKCSFQHENTKIVGIVIDIILYFNGDFDQSDNTLKLSTITLSENFLNLENVFEKIKNIDVKNFNIFDLKTIIYDNHLSDTNKQKMHDVIDKVLEFNRMQEKLKQYNKLKQSLIENILNGK